MLDCVRVYYFRLFPETAPLLRLKYCKAEQKWTYDQAVAALRSAPVVSPGVFYWTDVRMCTVPPHVQPNAGMVWTSLALCFAISSALFWFSQLLQSELIIFAFSLATAATSLTFMLALAEISVKCSYDFSVCCCVRWSTHWFQCDIQIPHDWKGKHVVLRWNSGGEAMVSVEYECQHKQCTVVPRLSGPRLSRPSIIRTCGWSLFSDN